MCLHQGDVVYLNFKGAVGNEIFGIRPAVIVSCDNYNRNANYIMVVPVTTHGSNFKSYVELKNYNNVRGRVNASQVHCFSTERVKSAPIDELRVKDFNSIINKVHEITLMKE